jgi:HAD superfamily hydrolase (TIGR01490 family)
LALAIFDLDNTLIAGDSDHSWGQFLVDQKLVDAEYFKQKNDEFYQDYVDGTLDMQAYLNFSLAPLAEYERSALNELHQTFMNDVVKGMMLPKAQKLVNKHRAQGDTLLVVTATNRFVTEPIVQSLGILHLLAIELEEADGKYTGKVQGVPSFKEGKVTRLNEWLEKNPHDLSEAYFYSDSHNDLPLLMLVGNPIAVDPDATLKSHALAQGWRQISLRD